MLASKDSMIDGEIPKLWVSRGVVIFIYAIEAIY
jgi:hypothetical protein